MITVDRLSFGYVKKPLCLKDIGFNVEEGKPALLLGGEAMGKTSLLRILAGLEKQFFGNVSIDGLFARDFKGKRSVSYLPSEPVFFEIAYN